MKQIFQLLILSLLSWNLAAISCPTSVSSLDEASREKILETVNRDRELIRRGELVLTNGEYALQGAFMKNLTWDCNVESKVGEMVEAMCNGSYGEYSIYVVPYATSLSRYREGLGSPIIDNVNYWTSSNDFNASTYLQLATDTRYFQSYGKQFTAYYLSDIGLTIGCAAYQCPARNWTQLICKTSPSVAINETIYVPGDPAVVTTPVPEPICSIPNTLLTSSHRTKLINGINEKRTQALNGTLRLYDGKYALQAQQMPMLTWDCDLEAKMLAIVDSRCTHATKEDYQTEAKYYDNEIYNTVDYYIHEFSKTHIDGISLKTLSNNTYGILLNYHMIDQRALHDKATKIGCAFQQCHFPSGGKPTPSTVLICTFDVNWVPLVYGTSTRVKIYEPRSSIVPTTVPPMTTTPDIQKTTNENITPTPRDSTECTTHYGETTVPSTTAPTAKCADGYVYFEQTNSCYGRAPEIGLDWYTWPKAEQYCEKQGGHLASIHSEEENQFIISFPEGHRWSIWVGLYSVDESYTWKWSDATPINYVPWLYGAGKPLYPDVNKSCVAADPYYDPRGSLFNEFCSKTNYFICKLPAQN